MFSTKFCAYKKLLLHFVIYHYYKLWLESCLICPPTGSISSQIDNTKHGKLTVCIRFSTNFFAAAKPSTLLWLGKSGERVEKECNSNKHSSGAIWENTSHTCTHKLWELHVLIFMYSVFTWISLPNVDVECFKSFFTRSRLNKSRPSTTKLNLREIEQFSQWNPYNWQLLILDINWENSFYTWPRRGLHNEQCRSTV